MSEVDVVVTEPQLVIAERDLSPNVVNSLRAVREGDRLLGGDGTLESLFDELPSAIAHRLNRITPADFKLSKITLKLVLAVNIPGVKIGGDVVVTLEPKVKS